MVIALLENILSQHIIDALHYINITKLCEIRLRVGMPIMINVLGKLFYLGKYGQTDNSTQSIVCSRDDIDSIMANVSNNALYSINDQLVEGYITCAGGIRVGVAGEFVYVNNNIKTIKNIQSLNIRVPHEVNNCSLDYLRFIQNNHSIYNTLILSPAGAGKTTFIRDLAKQLLRQATLTNILIVDERCEITGISNGQASFGGFNCDILSNCKKEYAFNNGIRSLRPDIIITDELSSKDIDCVANAISCGVKVIATIHAENVLDLKNKPEFSYILQNQMFDRFIVLGNKESPGEHCGVFDSNLECIGI